MNKTLKLFLSAVLAAVTLTACGDNKAKNKLLGGDATSIDEVGGAATPQGKAANAAQVAAIAAQMAGAGGTGMDGFMAAPRPAVSVSPAILTGMSVDSNGFYTFGADTSVKIRFHCTEVNPPDSVLYPFGSATMDPDLTLFAWHPALLIQVVVTGNDGAGNSFTADHVMGPVSGFTATTNMTLNGTVSVTGPYGTFNFTSSNIVVDASETANEGAIISGTETGTGTLPDGSTVNISLTWTNGAANGTVTVAGQTVNVHVNADGSGTYTDSTGVHAL